MTFVPLQSAVIPDTNAIPLALYAQIVGYDECAFWGIYRDSYLVKGCSDIWSLHQRETMRSYLALAQARMEEFLGYPIGQKWITNEYHAGAANPTQTEQGYVLKGGIRAVSEIAVDVSVDYNFEPARMTIPAPVFPLNEVVVFHAGTDLPISVAAMRTIGSNLLIEIPRCRLVAPEHADNPHEDDEQAYRYDETEWRAEVVDVRRVFTDDSVQAQIICGPGCHCTANCNGTAHGGCIYVKQSRIGEVIVRSTLATGNCCRPHGMTLNYLAGRPLDHTMRDLIIKLAHSFMPEAPCSCDILMRKWDQDRFVPEILTRERYECPFGLSNGAWEAFVFARDNRLMRAGALVGRGYVHS